MMNVTSHAEYTPDQVMEIFKTGPAVTRDKFVGRLESQPQAVLRDLASRERTLLGARHVLLASVLYLPVLLGVMVLDRAAF